MPNVNNELTAQDVFNMRKERETPRERANLSLHVLGTSIPKSQKLSDEEFAKYLDLCIAELQDARRRFNY